MSPKKLIIFLHIPKTGGTTLRLLMDKQYKRNLDFYGNEAHFQERATRLQKIIRLADSIRGHFSFGVHQHISVPFTYVTMLRHPIERTFSLFQHFVRVKEHPMHSTISSMSFDQFVEAYIHTTGLIKNTQTLLLCGKAPISFEQANAHIKTHFTTVGITEMFQESLFILQKELGWRQIPYKKENREPNPLTRGAVSQETIAKIIQHNALDIQLYNETKQRLIQKVQSYQ